MKLIIFQRKKYYSSYCGQFLIYITNHLETSQNHANMIKNSKSYLFYSLIFICFLIFFIGLERGIWVKNDRNQQIEMIVEMSDRMAKNISVKFEAENNNTTNVVLENIPWYKKSVDQLFKKPLSSNRPNFLSQTSNHCQLYKYPNGTSKSQKLLPKFQRMKFAFLKTHKCASSLIQKIFTKWMRKHDIHRKPALIGPFIGGYPGKFNYEVSRKAEESSANTGSIVNHMAWNLPELRKSFSQPLSAGQPEKRVEKDFFRIGLIRNPMSQYISTYNFYFAQRSADKFNNTFSCFGEPWRQIYLNSFKKSNKPSNKNIGNFFDKATDKQIESFKNAFWGFRGMNFMSADFGLDWKRRLTFTEIENRVNEFDVIIILERLVESLILVKNLLCMDMKDILLEDLECGRCSHNQTMADVIKNLAKLENMRKPVIYQSLSSEKLKKYNLTTDQSSIIEKRLNFNDIRLYNSAGRKFMKDLEIFGYDRMKSELLEFSQVTNQHLENQKKKKTEKDQKHKRIKRSKTLHLDPVYAKSVKYMIKEGKGYCGYFRKNFGVIPGVTDLDLEFGRQPWIDETDLEKIKI